MVDTYKHTIAKNRKKNGNIPFEVRNRAQHRRRQMSYSFLVDFYPGQYVNKTGLLAVRGNILKHISNHNASCIIVFLCMPGSLVNTAFISPPANAKPMELTKDVGYHYLNH